MTKLQLMLLILGIVLLLGIVIIPIINRITFKKLPPEQKVRAIMKQAKGLVYFKNETRGSRGALYYVKNKRKILVFPWALDNGKMVCVRKNPFEHWDYPEEKELLNENELEQLKDELEKYNSKSPVKIVFINEE